MRDIDAHADDESTANESRSKPYLNPRDVIALASTIPNCSQVTPPPGRHLSLKSTRTLQSQLSTDSTSYFSQISCHLTETFSIDRHDDDDDDEARRGDEAEVLSFLVSDAYSIEQLTAEAEGRTVRPNPLDGSGIARIDVYCQTGTVCTCRLIQTASASNAPLLNLVTPRAGNVTAVTTGNKYQNSTQFRRVVRLKCNLDALRTILTQPPKLPEIKLSAVQSTPPEGNDDNSQCSTVSKKLRKRRKDQLANKFAFLSRDQQKFLKEQKKMYEKRLRQDEKIRRNMANAILSGGINEGDPEITLPSLESLSLNDAVSSALTMETTETNETTNTIHQHCQTRQQLIQDKIEMADVGLAILMAEAQRLKKIMKEMEKLENDTKKDDEEEEDSYTSLDTDTERSRSTYQSTTDNEDGDGTIRSNDSDTVHTLQGCEVEYSFPHKFHDALEGALIGEMNEEESSFSEDDSLHLRNASKTKEQTRESRGRSPPRDGHHNGKNSSNIPLKRNEKLSPIVAIPTNGQGCVVLRQDGSFDVIGTIPDVLRRKLFRRNGPLPDLIAIGTKGRYYVHFDDGSFYLYGPRALTQILKKVYGHHQRKQKGGKRSNPPVSVVSVSFGKKLDDLFVVLSNGAWEAHGEIPRGLEDLMKDRNDRADLLWASIGVNGEWCVKANNGNIWWGNVTKEADEALTEIPGQDLMFIDFGIDGSYFLLYK